MIRVVAISDNLIDLNEYPTLPQSINTKNSNTEIIKRFSEFYKINEALNYACFARE